MSTITVLAGKEFKGYFSSWAAYIFVAVFVVGSLSAFFFHEEFFGVGRADTRGFFTWVPLLMVLLVSGLTMRTWARENEMRSVELLMTLPASTAQIVLGKFFACVGLVALALLFTLGIPITAEAVGDLDWGPVIGGYVGALLLAGAYVAIGLWVSSWFSDQFLALITTLVICFALAFVSHEAFLDTISDFPAAFISACEFTGFWGRFQKVGRGVIDFRDLLYYLSVTGLFLFLNVCTMRHRRWA